MRRAILILTAILIGAAQATAVGPAMERRLSRALGLFPEADADKDGKLSMAEAVAYLEAHPELSALLGGIPGGKASREPTSVAPTSPDLPPGPRVLICGHSFMIFTAKLLPPLAQAAGIGYRVAGSQMIGGSRVIQHWNLSDERNTAKVALREGRVDVLTLSPHVQLPDEGIDKFTKLGLEKNPKLRVLVQASWPAHDGEPSKHFSNGERDGATVERLREMGEHYRSTWLRSLEGQVRALNAAIGQDAVFIIPVGDAVLTLRERIAEGTVPGVTRQTDLFRDDLGHPLPPLAALVTYCHFASIFSRSPVGLPVTAELKTRPQAEELNRLLQQIAWDAVTRYPMSGIKTTAPQTAKVP